MDYNVEKHETTLITYMGLERGDLLLALAKVLANAGYKTALFDNSVSQDIWDIYNDKTASGNASDIGVRFHDNGLLISHDCMVTKKNTQYDYVITYSGTNVMEFPAVADYFIGGASPLESSIRAVGVGILTYNGNNKTRGIYLYRDMVAVSERKMAGLLNLPQGNELISVKIDPDEYDSWCAYTRDQGAGLVRHLGESREALKEILTILMGDDKNASKKAETMINKGGKL